MPVRPSSEEADHFAIDDARSRIDPKGEKGFALRDLIKEAAKPVGSPLERRLRSIEGTDSPKLSPQSVKEVVARKIDQGELKAKIEKIAGGTEIRYYPNDGKPDGFNPLKGKIDRSVAYKPIPRSQMSPLFHGETRLPIFLEMVRKSLAHRTDAHSVRAFHLASGLLRGTAMPKGAKDRETYGYDKDDHGKSDGFTLLGKELADLGHPMANALNWHLISRSFALDKLVHGFLNGSFEKHRGDRSDFNFYKDIFQGFSRDETHKKHEKEGAKWNRANEADRKKFWERLTSFVKSNAKQFGIDPSHVTEAALEKSMGRAVIKAFMKEREGWKPGAKGRIPNYARNLPEHNSPEKYSRLLKMMIRFARATSKTGIASKEMSDPDHANKYALERKNFREALSLMGANEDHPHYDSLVDGEFDRAKKFHEDYPYHPASLRYSRVYSEDHPNHYKIEAASNLVHSARSSEGKSPDWLGSHPVDPHQDFLHYVLSNQEQDPSYNYEVLHEYISDERRKGRPREEILDNLSAAGIHPQAAEAHYETNLDRERVPYVLNQIKSEYGAIKSKNDARAVAIKLLNEGKEEEQAVHVLRLLDRGLDDFDAKQLFRKQQAFRDSKRDFADEIRFGTGVERLVDQVATRYGLTPENAFEVVKSFDRDAATKPKGKPLGKKELATMRQRTDPKGFVLGRLNKQPDEVVAENLKNLYGVKDASAFVRRIRREVEHRAKMQEKLVDKALFLRKEGQYDDEEIVDSLIKQNGISEDDARGIINLADSTDTDFDLDLPE